MRHSLPILILMLAITCSCGARQAVPAGNGTPVTAPGTESQHGLPALDTLRNPSISYSHEQDGSMAAQQSLTAIVDGSELSLPSGSNFASWGIWSFDCGYDYPTLLNAVVDVPDGDEFWLAVSDYDSGRWRFSGPYGSGVAIELSSANRSPLNLLHVAVLTGGGSSVSVQKLVLSSDNGWKVLDLGIPMTGLLWESMAGCLVDGLPAVAYCDTSGGVSYLRATDPVADDMGDWQQPPVQVAVESTYIIGLSLAAIGGKPALAYALGDPCQATKFSSSSTVEAQPGDWLPAAVEIDSGSGGAYGGTSLVDLQGHPALAFISTGRHIEFVRSTTPFGADSADWGNRLIVMEHAQSSDTYQYPQLVLDRGKPFITLIRQHGETVAVASETAFGGKPADWSKPAVISRWQDGNWGEHSTFLFEGDPVCFDCDFSVQPQDEAFLWFVLSDSNPAVSGWEGRRNAGTIASQPYLLPSGASVGGLPAVAYRGSSSVGLRFTFSDPLSEFPHVYWVEQEVSNGQLHDGISCIRLLENSAGQPCIFFCAHDSEIGYKLMYAVRREP
ncbi:MAG: hypothetical protein R3F46_05040 [bacterium]